MRKIPSLFQRGDAGNRLVFDNVVPACEWVLAGEGRATRKWDGTACLVRDGRLFKRYDAKHGKKPPEGWEPAQPEPDEGTGHWPGWLSVGEGPDDRWHREAWVGGAPPDGTYELCGPKVQGNPERLQAHVLIPHGAMGIQGDPRTFDEVRDFLKTADVEGIVWHHEDGRRAKIKAKDFGLARLGWGERRESA